MKTRVITAVVALLVLAPFIIFSDTPALLVFSSLLSVIAVGEIFACVAHDRIVREQEKRDGLNKLGKLWKCFIAINPAAFVISVVIAATMPILARYSRPENFYRYIFIIFFTYMFTILSIAVFMKRTYPVADAAFEIVMTLYTSYGFSSLVLLRDMQHGFVIFLIAFMVPWVSDAAAYFVGSRLGKHKLIPLVSPKKTVEGSIGGIVFGTLSMLLYGLIIHFILDIEPQYGGLAFAGFVISVVAQCGDLIMSLIKRHYNIKDYGKVFPGHGGVLDRFDSIIATAPFLYILCIMLARLKLFI